MQADDRQAPLGGVLPGGSLRKQVAKEVRVGQQRVFRDLTPDLLEVLIGVVQAGERSRVSRNPIQQLAQQKGTTAAKVQAMMS